MNDDVMQDDSSHYEISLTAGQAFLAFVLLLFSLAASFAFGVIIGKGDGADRLVVRRDPAVINESSSTATSSRIVELGVAESSEVSEAPKVVDPAIESAQEAPAAAEVIDEDAGAPSVPAAPVQSNAEAPVTAAPPQPAAPVSSSGPVFVQLLSSSDQKAAEGLAAKLIDSGFTSSFVEKVRSDSGATVYRVRVRYSTEGEARTAIDRLRPFVKNDPWVTRQ